MADDAARGKSRLFMVRIWAASTGNGVEHRGSVRDVESGAFRHFRAWADLTAFLASRVERDRLPNEE